MSRGGSWLTHVQRHLCQASVLVLSRLHASDLLVAAEIASSRPQPEHVAAAAGAAAAVHPTGQSASLMALLPRSTLRFPGTYMRLSWSQQQVRRFQVPGLPFLTHRSNTRHCKWMYTLVSISWSKTKQLCTTKPFCLCSANRQVSRKLARAHDR